MGGPAVDKSAPSPSTFFHGTRSTPSSPLSSETTQTTKGKQKTKEKNSRRSYLHGLSFFHKHMAIMTTA